MDPRNISAEDAKEYIDKTKCLEEASELLYLLKLELALREENEYIGTGMGGNPAQLFFLMTHRIKFMPSNDDLVHFSNENSGEIVLHCPAKFNLTQARNALTEFYFHHHDKKDIGLEQLINPSFLRDLNSSSIEIKILINVLDRTIELRDCLDSKIKFRSDMRKFFQKETDALQAQFLREMGLPHDYLKKPAKNNTDNEKVHYETNPVSGLFNEHPIWGTRNNEVNKRLSEMEERLLSQEDNDTLVFIGACPAHITMLVTRAIINIERIVSLNLDENKSCSFLAEINRKLESKRKNN